LICFYIFRWSLSLTAISALQDEETSLALSAKAFENVVATIIKMREVNVFMAVLGLFYL
jgi:hypothetical protein